MGFKQDLPNHIQYKQLNLPFFIPANIKIPDYPDKVSEKVCPFKRMLRVSKLTLAALEAVLHLYRDPESLPEKLTVLKQLTRPREDILLQVNRVIEGLKNCFEDTSLSIHSQDVMSQIGS